MGNDKIEISMVKIVINGEANLSYTKLCFREHGGIVIHSGRALDSELRGPGFDPQRRHCVVSLSKTH